jgi:hypothetical protein
MNDEKIVTVRFESYSAAGELVLNEVDVAPDVAEALQRGQAVAAFAHLPIAASRATKLANGCKAGSTRSNAVETELSKRRRKRSCE